MSEKVVEQDGEECSESSPTPIEKECRTDSVSPDTSERPMTESAAIRWSRPVSEGPSRLTDEAEDRNFVGVSFSS